MIRIILDSPEAEHFHVEVDGKRAGSPRLSFASIYLLEVQLPLHLLQDGVRLDMDPAGLKNRLAFELSLHAAYLHLVYHAWPRLYSRSPFRAGPLPQNFDQAFHGLRTLTLARSMPHCHHLKDTAKGSAILLASPGPSLDLDFVAANKDRLVVVAIGRAIGILAQAGIPPDVCYIQDTHPPTWHTLLDDVDENALTDTILVVNPAAPVPDYAQRFQAVYKAWNCHPFETDELPKLEESPPSATTGGYSLARLLGGHPIISQGADCGSPLEPERAKELPEHFNSLLNAHEAPDPNQAYGFYSEILLRFGGELAVSTMPRYLDCAQWVKSRAFRDKLEHGLEFYDQSLTGMLCFNSVIQPADQAPPLPETKRLALPQSPPTADPRPYAEALLKRFSSVDKFLKPGEPIPGVSLRAPFNCIFHGVKDYDGTRFVPQPDDYDLARERLDNILSTLGDILNQAS